MTSAEEARQLQHSVKLQKEHAQIEFEAKYTYIDENGKKQYYSDESFEDIINKIEECCKSSFGNTDITVRNRVHPDTVRKLKELGYRVFLNMYETYDIRPNINKCGKRVYERVIHNWISTCISWGGIPIGIGKFEEL